jgi:hypothetical protein
MTTHPIKPPPAAGEGSMSDQFSNEVWEIACRSFDEMEPSQEIPMLCRAILEERQRCVDACRSLEEHMKSRGQFKDAFTAGFIAQQISCGAHVLPLPSQPATNPKTKGARA